MIAYIPESMQVTYLFVHVHRKITISIIYHGNVPRFSLSDVKIFSKINLFMKKSIIQRSG